MHVVGILDVQVAVIYVGRVDCEVGGCAVFVRADVDATVLNTTKATAALIKDRDGTHARHVGGISHVDGEAAWQEGVRLSEATVVGQRAELRLDWAAVGADLIGVQVIDLQEFGQDSIEFTEAEGFVAGDVEDVELDDGDPFEAQG